MKAQVTVKPLEIPRFQESKEYRLTSCKQPGGRNPASGQEAVYIFISKVDGTERKYPLFLFRHKKAGWRETFTPMQLMEFKVSAADSAAK